MKLTQKQLDYLCSAEANPTGRTFTGEAKGIAKLFDTALLKPLGLGISKITPEGRAAIPAATEALKNRKADRLHSLRLAVLEKLVWTEEPLFDLGIKTAFSIVENFEGRAGINPEGLGYHTMFLTQNIYGPGVLVEGGHGDGRFHCTYHDRMPWEKMPDGTMAVRRSNRIAQARPIARTTRTRQTATEIA